VDIPATRHRMPAMSAGLPGSTGARRENRERKISVLSVRSCPVLPKQDYIPAGIQFIMVWHDQFKTAVLANAAGLNRSKQREQSRQEFLCSLRFLLFKSGPRPAATADSSRGKLMRRTKTDSTGANRGNGERKENLCSLRLLLLNSGRDGDADFKFLA